MFKYLPVIVLLLACCLGHVLALRQTVVTPTEFDFELTREGADAFRLPPVDAKLARNNLEESARFGLPNNWQRTNLRLFNSFLLSYDRRLKGPAWVMEHLTNANFATIKADRNKSFFKQDNQLHPYFAATEADYANSGYDRGHQASAGDFRSDQVAMDQTFALSNVWPQRKELNRGAWVRLEYYIRALAANETVKNVYVVTGPLFLPVLRNSDKKLVVRYPVIGPSNVAVPTHFYKVFLVETNQGELSMEAFCMPNTSEPKGDIESILKYRVPIGELDWIERAAGVLFFEKVDRKRVQWPEKLQYNYKDEKVTFDAN